MDSHGVYLHEVYSCFNEIVLPAFYILLFSIGTLLYVLVNGHNFKIPFCFLSWIVIKSIVLYFEYFCSKDWLNVCCLKSS